MLIIYVSFIFFDGMLLSDSHINKIPTREMANPDFWTLANITSIEFQEHNNSTQQLRRHRRSLLHHHVKRSHSKNFIDVNEVDSRRPEEKKRSEVIVDPDDDREKPEIVDSDDDSGNSEQKRSVTPKEDRKRSKIIVDSEDDQEKSKIVDSDDDSDDSEQKRSKEDQKRLKAADSDDDKSKMLDADDEAENSEQKRSPLEGRHNWLKKRGVMKKKHHSKRVAKEHTTAATDVTPGREKRSSVRYVGDTLFALELFLLFIPLACVTVVVLSLLHVCWSRTCKNKQGSQWASEVQVSPAVDVPPKQHITDIVSELVTNDLMACGDAIGRRVKLERMTGHQPPARKKSLHKRIPAKDVPDSSDPPKSTSSLYIVRPVLMGEGGHFPSTATFDSHVVGDTKGRRSLRLKAFINHHHHHHRKESEPQKNEGKGGSRAKQQVEESPRRPAEANKRRHKAKNNLVEESSLSSSFQYPNYYHQDNEFYDMEH